MMKPSDNPKINELLTLIDVEDYEAALLRMERIDENRLSSADKGRLLAIGVLCMDGMGAVEAAEDTLSMAVATCKIDPDFGCAAGEQFIDLDEFDKAEYLFERLCLAHPKRAAGWYKLALVYELTERYKEALTAYETAIPLDPNHADAYRGQGSCLDALGKLPEAAQAYRRYLEARPDDGDEWITLAHVYSGMEDYDAAYEALARAEQLEADPLRLYFLWAHIAWEKSDRERVERCVKSLQRVDDSDWRTKAAAAMAAEFADDPKRGWQDCLEAFEMAVHDTNGEALNVAGELTAAYALRNELLEEFDAFVPQLFEWNVLTEKVLGMMRIRAGEYGDPISDFAVILEGEFAPENLKEYVEDDGQYGPPFHYFRMVRVLAKSPKDAKRMATEFETRCGATGVIVHEAQRSPFYKGGGHAGVWQHNPADFIPLEDHEVEDN